MREAKIYQGDEYKDPDVSAAIACRIRNFLTQEGPFRDSDPAFEN